MDQDTVKEFKQIFSGNVILPRDDQYETARITYVSKDSHPAIIVQPKTIKDIQTALSFGQNNSLRISVRSGKHSVAGFSTNDGGLVLDLANFNSIEVLDKEAGLVRLGTGATWGDVAVELAKYNLAISSGDTKSVGVGGLTLGGGIGWMLRKYGFTIDSLVGAEVVLADGSVVKASKSENPDLFWAIRGGGGNFGVVTYFDFKAHPVENIVVATTIYGVSNLQKIITGWRDHMRSAPRELTSFLTLMTDFGGPTPNVMLMSCYSNSDLKAANKVIEPLRNLGEIISDETKVVDYPEILQEAHPPEGVRFSVKDMFVKNFDDDLIAQLSTICCKEGSPIVQLRIMSGAIDDVNPDATAMAHRNNEVFLFAGFPIPLEATKEEEAHIMENWDLIASHSSGKYSNFLSSNTKNDVSDIYPESTYKRLASIKLKYDPKNILNHNFNIKPALLR
ncbi:FAD-binding oxidoreductase [Patescibacteria group bacterium]|nr:MAG: FAD-binding oxidoreductase [Patescibacteria group bacterium]